MVRPPAPSPARRSPARRSSARGSFARRAARSAAALLAAALAAGACADPAGPAPSAPSARPSAARLDGARAGGRQLPALQAARSNRLEPSSIRDRVRFDITLRFLSPVTADQRAAFEQARARWQRIIIGDVPSITGTLPAGLCLAGAPDITGTVDDIVIDVRLQPIDGPGRVLGAAGPCFIRTADNLPVYGVMFFDTADLDAIQQFGLLDEVVVHEMGHVLGFGTLWDFERALLAGTAADPIFTGRLATAFFRTVGGRGPVPVENIGGPGTRFSHWRESVFDNELMTGFLNLGDNPLSRVTSGSMRDLGYQAVPDGDPYRLPEPADAVAAALAVPGGPGIDIAASERRIDPVAVVPAAAP